MHIKIFMQTANGLREKETLRNFGTGIQRWMQDNVPEYKSDIVRVGRWLNDHRPEYICEFEYSEEYVPCDVAVLLGSWKPREKGHHQIRNSVVSNAEKFIVIETALLNRVTDGINEYHRVGINGYLNQSAYWPKVDKDLAQERLKRLGISWPGWDFKNDGHVLIALQLPGDASLRGQDINDWAFNAVKDIRKITDRPIRIRNHPLISDRGFETHGSLAIRLLQSGYKNITLSDGSEIAWKEDLKGAYCTVTYSSGLAIDSVLSGIPTIACDPGNFAYSISTNFVQEIDQLKLAGRDTIADWLHQLSMCQWSLSEMQTPLVMEHLYPILQQQRLE